MGRVPGGFGAQDVMGVRRPSRAVDLTADQRRALEQMALQQQEQAMFEQAGLGRADEPYSDPLMGAWNKVVEARIPTDRLPGWDLPFTPPQLLPFSTPAQAFFSGGPQGMVEWMNTAKEMGQPAMPRDVGVTGEHANIPIPLLPKALGVGAGAGLAARKPIARALRRLLGSGDEAVSAVAPVVRETTEAAGRASRQTFRNVDDLSDAAQPAWEGGPTLYHGGGQDISAFTRMDPAAGTSLGGRSAMGDALYTTPNVPFASRYANAPQRAATKHAEYFGGPPPTPVPGFVHNVKFTGEGALPGGKPNLLDYGAVGVADDAKRAVMGTLEQMDDLLGVSGTRLWTDAELAPLMEKLFNPRATFADVHGFADAAVIGGSESSLRGFVEMVAKRNTPDSALWNEKVSTVMSRLRTRLRDAGYHGYVAPEGGGFHIGQKGWHGETAEPFGGAVAWFTPERDLTIVGSARLGS